ncbi:MAG: signal peptidase I [Bacilli bacterium]|nr:signal peptidase I [Bacilli bacterium]
MRRVKLVGRLFSSMFLCSLLMILASIALMVVLTVGDQLLAKKDHIEKNPLFSAYVIISPSMVPNINVYDAVVTIRASEDNIQMYDIITFLSKEIETHGVPITHRVVGLLKTDVGESAYRTKGDNNNKEDNAIILQSEVIGKVFCRIPMLGYVRTFVTSKIGFLLSVVLPLTVSFMFQIWKILNRNKNKKLEEEVEII